MTALTFSKQERMVSRRLIEALFSGEHSASMAQFPLRAVYMTVDRPEGAQPAQLLVSVSKKRFRHAVDRNRVKRQIREAYRHHKQLLGKALPPDRQLLLALVWLTDEHRATSNIDDNVRRLMERISEKL